MGRLIPRPWIDFGYLEADCVIYPHPSGHQIVTPHDTGVCEAIETGQSHWYGFDEPSPGAVLLRDAGVFAASLTASSLGGEPFGLLLVSSRDPAYTFSEHDLSLIKVIAGIVGPPMANLRAAEDVRRQRALYDTALSSLAEAVILLDESGQAVFSNSAGTEIVEVLARFPHEPAVGMAVDIPPQVADDFLAAIVDRRQRAGSRIPVTVDGQQRWYNYEFIPLEFEPPRTLAIARDVSAEVQRELAEERHREEIAKAARLSALGGLIGGVAHELNNPLTAILGFAEIMQAEGAGFAEEIAVIQEEARRARDIVRDLLFIVRPGPVQFGEVPLNDVVRHVERLRRSAWRQLGVTAQVDVDEASPTVTGNAHHLTQVLLNLVTNAEDALAGSEQPRLAIRVLAEAGNAVLTVSDNGVGMDSETARHIFEPFFTTKAGKGTGLGLSVIHNILQIHHGCIDVSSAPGEGSTFTLTIPLAANKTSAAAPEPAGSAIAAARRARVLVIDDEPAVRSVSQRLIESLGHDVVTAANVDEALGAVCRTDFDSIICDYRLGSETATQFVDRLPAERAGSITETMIIATGATTDSGVSKLVERCGLRLLPKPFGLEQLRAVLEG
jgi:signal transduction histidine kinase/CheY-like chemotaxis protein